MQAVLMHVNYRELFYLVRFSFTQSVCKSFRCGWIFQDMLVNKSLISVRLGLFHRYVHGYYHIVTLFFGILKEITWKAKLNREFCIKYSVVNVIYLRVFQPNYQFQFLKAVKENAIIVSVNVFTEDKSVFIPHTYDVASK